MRWKLQPRKLVVFACTALGAVNSSTFLALKPPEVQQHLSGATFNSSKVHEHHIDKHDRLETSAIRAGIWLYSSGKAVKPTFNSLEINGGPAVLLAGDLSDQLSSLEELSCTCNPSNIVAIT